jgi:hypothetical protein
LKPTGKSNSIIINKFSKKPGFWPPARSQRNRVFARIYASKPRIIEKTRFLATRASQETGFLPESTHQNQELSKKPGFWAFRALMLE